MKSVLMIGLLVLVIAVGAMASETRVLTMGDNNMILLDEANIEHFPSRIVEYPDLAIAEFGNNDFTKFGVHWKFREDKPCVLGTYLHANTTDNFDYSPVMTTRGNRKLDLYHGRMLGDHKFGLHLGYSQFSDKDEKANSKDETGNHILRLTVGLTPDGDKFDVAAGLVMHGWTEKLTDTADNAYELTKPSGAMLFHVKARYFSQQNQRLTVIPHVGFEFGNLEYDTSATGVPNYNRVATRKYSMMKFDLGLGMEYSPASNVLAILNFGLIYDKLNHKFTPVTGDVQELDDKTFTLPYFKMGLDADVFKWMDVRFGATSYWENRTEDAGGNKDFSKYPENETYLGFGFHWNRLHVDVHSDPEMFLDGFNFISGTANNMNFRISAVYEMK